MSSRRLFRILIFTCWIPVVCGVVATLWLSRQEISGAGYESTAKLTSEAWKKEWMKTDFHGSWRGDGDDRDMVGAMLTLESSLMKITVREAMGFGDDSAKVKDVGVETSDLSLGVFRVRVVGPDGVLVQAYLKELLNQYALWRKKSAEVAHGDTVEPIIKGILQFRAEVQQLDEQLHSLGEGSVQAGDTRNIVLLKQERDIAAKRMAELAAQLEAADAKVGKSKETFTILEEPTAPTRVKMPIGEAAVLGGLLGGGAGLFLIVLIALVTTYMRPSRVGTY